jgi:hypothetical protein
MPEFQHKKALNCIVRENKSFSRLHCVDQPSLVEMVLVSFMGRATTLRYGTTASCNFSCNLLLFRIESFCFCFGPMFLMHLCRCWFKSRNTV